MKTKPRTKRKAPIRRPKTSSGARLVRIGNSRGVRLPKAVIEQAGLREKVEISVVGDQVIIRAADVKEPRAGWEEQIKAALAEHGDDVEDWHDWQNMPNKFDEEEWTW